MLKYIGKGDALVTLQVPARDLTDEEVEQFGEDVLLKSGLYEKPVRAVGGPVKAGQAYLVGERPSLKSKKSKGGIAESLASHIQTGSDAAIPSDTTVEPKPDVAQATTIQDGE